MIFCKLEHFVIWARVRRDSLDVFAERVSKLLCQLHDLINEFKDGHQIASDRLSEGLNGLDEIGKDGLRQ